MMRCFFLTLIFTGCAVNAPFTSLDSDPIVAETSNTSPTEWTVALVGCSVEFDPAVLNKEAKDRHAIEPDEEWLNSLIRDGVERSRLFRKVLVVSAKGDRALEDAWRSGADLLLVPYLLKYEAFYGGANKLYIWNLINWLFLWAPSWFVRDEVYGVRGEMELRLISCHSGRLLWRRVISFSAVRSLDDFERGWKFFGIFTVPKSLNESNWLKVDDSLRMFVEREIKLSVLSVLHRDLRKALKRGSLLERLGKRCGLFVGINRYRSGGLPRLSFAADDAAAFARIVRPKDQPTADRNLLLLADNAATEKSVRNALKTIVQRATPFDEVILYFAGYGITRPFKKRVPVMEEEGKGREQVPSKKRSGGKKELRFKTREFLRGFILLYDSNPRSERPGLGIDELLNILSGCRAGRIIVVIDCGFNAERVCRGASDKNYSGRVDLEPVRSFVEKEGRFVVFAGRYCLDGAAEFEHHKRGVMTGYLEAATKAGAEADTNRDGKLTLLEMFKYASPRVVEETQMEACPQHPVLFGTGADKLILFERRRR